MTRPPLSNLFAVHDADPAALDEMMLDLQRGAEFARVWRPAPGWVAASAPLPGGEPDGDLVSRHQLAFAEGRDVLVERSGKDPAGRFREIVELAARGARHRQQGWAIGARCPPLAGNVIHAVTMVIEDVLVAQSAGHEPLRQRLDFVGF